MPVPVPSHIPTIPPQPQPLLILPGRTSTRHTPFTAVQERALFASLPISSKSVWLIEWVMHVHWMCVLHMLAYPAMMWAKRLHAAIPKPPSKPATPASKRNGTESASAIELLEAGEPEASTVTEAWPPRPSVVERIRRGLLTCFVSLDGWLRWLSLVYFLVYNLVFWIMLTNAAAQQA